MFFTAFGALWLMLSLYARETLSVATVTGVLLGVVALAWNAIYLLRAARRLPPLPTTRAWDVSSPG